MAEIPANDPELEKQLAQHSLGKAYASDYLEGSSASKVALIQQLNIMKATLDSIGDAVLVWDKDEITVLANQAAVKLAGGRELVNLHRSDILSAYQIFQSDGITPFAIERLPYAIAVRQKKPASDEGLVKGLNMPADGVWIRSLASPILDKDMELLGVITVMQDITERKRIERQRNALATLITHDLKNHLGAWEMLFKLLGARLTEDLSPDYVELIEGLQADNLQFLDLCNSLLELYRSDALNLRFKHTGISVEQLVSSAVMMNEHRAATLAVKLNLNIEADLPKVIGIPAALRQGLHNLIQNAVEVVGQNGVVDIEVLKSAKPAVVFQVKDNGPGMSEETIRKLFDQSRVVSTVPTGVRSTGFGLYLTRLLVEAQGGSISCVSELGKGTTVSIELPCMHRFEGAEVSL